MRNLIGTIAGISLTTIALLAPLAFAADPDVPERLRTARIEKEIFHQQAHATLTESPYYAEIRDVNEDALRTEQELLAALRTTTDEEELSRLVNRLERLEVERELKVLSEIRLGSPAYSTPIAANGVLYVASQKYLWAVK